MNCLITGASRGIGFELAKYFFKQKLSSCTCKSANEQSLKTAFDSLETKENDFYIRADLSKPSAADIVLKNLQERNFTTDIFLNNVGIYTEDSWESMDFEALSNLLQINAFTGFDFQDKL